MADAQPLEGENKIKNKEKQATKREPRGFLHMTHILESLVLVGYGSRSALHRKSKKKKTT